MYKYQAIFSKETHPKEKIKGGCAFVISLSFHQQEFSKKNTQEDTDELHKFSAVLRRLNLAFDKIDIILADTLNKHNVFLYFLDKDAEKKSLSLGDFWLKSKYFKEIKNYLTIKYTIFRWNELILKKEFSDLKYIIEDVYNKNNQFCAIVDSVRADYVAFLCRNRKKVFEDKISDKFTSFHYINFDIKKTYDSCLNYIIEECAITLLLRLNSYENLFHIGKVNEAVGWTAKNFFKLDTKHDLLINKINNNPLNVISVLKFKPLKNLRTSASNSKKVVKEESSRLDNTIFEKSHIFRRKTLHDVIQKNHPQILKRQISI